MGAWQDAMQVVYQNYLHPIETQVDTGVSSPNFGVGYELENTMNLIPSRPGRFAQAADPRGGPTTKIIRYNLPRSLTIDCLAIVNVHSFLLKPGVTGAIDTERETTVELFHGAGSANYGQGSGSPGTAIGSTFTMSESDVAKYGANLFFRFNSVNASLVTVRFSCAGANIASTSIGNILIGRYFSFPVDLSTDGWMLLAPTRKKIQNSTVRAGRSFGAVQIETRYPTLRSWSIPTVWRSESLREDFERYWGNREQPRFDGVQNQHMRKRLDLPTAIVPPWQWAGNPSSYGYPVFGTLGPDLDVQYDELGNSVTNIPLSEIA